MAGLRRRRSIYSKVGDGFCSCEAYNLDSLCRSSWQSKSTLGAGVMQCGEKVPPNDLKLPCEKELPHIYCIECSLPMTISPSLRVILCEEDTDVLERCSNCGFHNIKPPTECKMWQAHIKVTYLARRKVVLSDKSAVYERKFDKADVSIREA